MQVAQTKIQPPFELSLSAIPISAHAAVGPPTSAPLPLTCPNAWCDMQQALGCGRYQIELLSSRNTSLAKSSHAPAELVFQDSATKQSLILEVYATVSNLQQQLRKAYAAQQEALSPGL